MSDSSTPRVIIVGAGATGLSAAFAAGWRGARVTLIDPLGPGGQLLNAGPIETVPGLAPIAGPELVDAMVSRLEGLDVETVFGTATAVHREFDSIVVTTDSGETITGDVVILAAGSKPRAVGVPGEVEFEYLGVSHCAACDGPLFKAKRVVVVGSGDGAANAALSLRDAGADVSLAVRGPRLKAAAALRARVESATDVKVLVSTELVEVRGDGVVGSVRLRSTVDATEFDLPVSGVFTAVGTKVAIEELARELDRDAEGRVVVDAYLASSMPGVFAAGSVRRGASDQLVGSMGDGVNAVENALRWFRGELDLAFQPIPAEPAGHHSVEARTAAPVYAKFFDEVAESGVGDGLPVVPLTARRVEAFLDACQIEGDEVLHSNGASARDLAECAVAAGCLPAYAGIVLASAQSLLIPGYGIDTLRESSLVVVVNGPDRLINDLNCSDGMLGPGWRANATIGRALRLFASGPLGVPRSTGFGDPGQLTFCFGEDEEKSQWPPLHVDRGFGEDTSAVTVFPAATFRQVMDRADHDHRGVIDFLAQFVRGRAAGTKLFPGRQLSLMFVLDQEMRRMLAPHYSKAELRSAVYEKIIAVDGPGSAVQLPDENSITIVAAGGVAFPAAWVFTTADAALPVTVAVGGNRSSLSLREGALS